MNTIYWLSVFGAIVGYLVFIASILGALWHKHYGVLLIRAYLQQNGILGALRWMWLLFAIASTIVFMTI